MDPFTQRQLVSRSPLDKFAYSVEIGEISWLKAFRIV